MRGLLHMRGLAMPALGIIPAHAGLTAYSISFAHCARDHSRVCGAHSGSGLYLTHFGGSSPRMRGSRIVAPYFPHSEGIIPAHAGLTNLVGSTVSTSGDHPRACGAHSGVVRRSDSQKGSSPRMRGSPSSWRNISPSPGIIPAHAGLTSSGCTAYRASRDHPRACGAHDTDTITNRPLQGSSPRMRSSRRTDILIARDLGIIPAHAELTPGDGADEGSRGDHPRACGAHLVGCMACPLSMGSSPRMRGSPFGSSVGSAVGGIIPAHAGLTAVCCFLLFSCRDHPRACGAHPVSPFRCAPRPGSSPRMRGSHRRLDRILIVSGIIPAHAGLTHTATTASSNARDHPRACGAHCSPLYTMEHGRGSSPRMRGSHSTIFTVPAPPGIIPAHAGLTLIKRGDLDKMRDHPRACGAHMPFTQDILSAAGSSPRMRGSLFGSLCKHILKGIIPAHAGLTLTKVARILDLRDHPRACGAHPLLTTSSTVSRGSSPRMRGSHGFCDADVRVMGIIPAHAGLTRKKKALKYGDRDHPRACGAHDDFALHCNTESGSSPRMRGSRVTPRWAAEN